MTSRGPVLPTERVAGEIRTRIEAGEWAKDERLPSVAALAGQHRSTRATVTKALHILEREGLVVIVPSWGTFRA